MKLIINETKRPSQIPIRLLSIPLRMPPSLPLLSPKQHSSPRCRSYDRSHTLLPTQLLHPLHRLFSAARCSAGSLRATLHSRDFTDFPCTRALSHNRVGSLSIRKRTTCSIRPNTQRNHLPPSSCEAGGGKRHRTRSGVRKS